MLKSLGRDGVEELVDRHCRIASNIARKLAQVPGIRVLNEVNLNQIVVEFGAATHGPEARQAMTEAVITRLRESSSIFVGGARWKGVWVMRISVICSATGFDDTQADFEVITAAWLEIQATALKEGSPS